MQEIVPFILEKNACCAKWFCLGSRKRVAFLLRDGFWIALHKLDDAQVWVTAAEGTDQHVPASLFNMSENRIDILFRSSHDVSVFDTFVDLFDDAVFTRNTRLFDEADAWLLQNYSDILGRKDPSKDVFQMLGDILSKPDPAFWEDKDVCGGKKFVAFRLGDYVFHVIYERYDCRGHGGNMQLTVIRGTESYNRQFHADEKDLDRISMAIFSFNRGNATNARMQRKFQSMIEKINCPESQSQAAILQQIMNKLSGPEAALLQSMINCQEATPTRGGLIVRTQH